MPPIDHYWEHYMMFPTVRKSVVQRAAGLVSFAETANLAVVATSDNTTARYLAIRPRSSRSRHLRAA
ncbi:multidrug resistance-associated abc transporter [Colletotrichum kahawae]|uniref:Multidrug resistance-associated abc transporter n=1 Tax=Colletotrichum kahawae TaxID=34407 RepID=A0AAE0D701_COLKA|nr:multidrug resistance-associated abc transporter [Colletotrichum kahawae]